MPRTPHARIMPAPVPFPFPVPAAFQARQSPTIPLAITAIVKRITGRISPFPNTRMQTVESHPRLSLPFLLIPLLIILSALHSARPLREGTIAPLQTLPFCPVACNPTVLVVLELETQGRGCWVLRWVSGIPVWDLGCLMVAVEVPALAPPKGVVLIRRCARYRELWGVWLLLSEIRVWWPIVVDSWRVFYS